MKTTTFANFINCKSYRGGTQILFYFFFAMPAIPAIDHRVLRNSYLAYPYFNANFWWVVSNLAVTGSIPLCMFTVALSSANISIMPAILFLSAFCYSTSACTSGRFGRIYVCNWLPYAENSKVECTLTSP